MEAFGAILIYLAALTFPSFNEIPDLNSLPQSDSVITEKEKNHTISFEQFFEFYSQFEIYSSDNINTQTNP